MSQVLLSKLSLVRRKQVGVSSGAGAALAAAFIVLALAVGMFLDWLIRFPLPVRICLLAVDLAVLVWLALTYVVWPITLGPDDDTLALAVESDEPGFRGRLIAAVQLSRPNAIAAGTSKSMVRALVRETESMASKVDFAKVVKTDNLVKFISGGVLIVLLAIVIFATTEPSSGILLRRAFLSTEPVPRKTRVVAVSGGGPVAVGDSFTIEAKAAGIHPSSGYAVIRYGSGPNQRIQKVTLDLTKDTRDDYAATVANVQEPFTYVVYLYDGQGDEFSIQAVPRPAVAAVDCWEVFPKYTHLAPEKHLPGDLTLLQGSHLVLAVVANKPLKTTASTDEKRNRVHLAGVDGPDTPLAVPSDASSLAAGAHPGGKPADATTVADGIDLPPTTTGFSIYLVDQGGIESKDPAVYPITLEAKQPPSIKVLNLTKEEIPAVLQTRQPIAYDAADKYALGKLSIHYKVEGDDQEHEAPIPLAGNPKHATGSFFWEVSSLVAAAGATRPSLEGSAVEFWLRAEDTNDVSNADHKPGYSDSDHYQLQILSQSDFDAEMASRDEKYVATPIQELTHHQQDVSGDLGKAIIKRGPATQPSDGQ